MLYLFFSAVVDQKQLDQKQREPVTSSQPPSMPSSSQKMAAMRLVVWGLLLALLCGCAGGAVDLQDLSAFSKRLDSLEQQPHSLPRPLFPPK
eukprot:SAG22_NODE_1811_length_3525_cov_12.037653_3_plen_92_part_00